MRSVHLRTFCVFVLCVSGKAQSPCPSTFVYEDDGFGPHGVVTIRPNGPVSYINLKVNLTVAARLPTSYFGTLEPVYTDERSLRRGDPIKYHVHFPISRPLPLLTSIVANGKLLCYGPGDIPGPYNLVTTINLEHVLTVNSATGVSPFATDFIIPDDLPNELFEKLLITKVQTAVNNIHVITASGSGIAEPRPKPVVLPLPPPAILKPDIRPSAEDFTVKQPIGINPVDRIDTSEVQCGLVRVTLGSRPLVLLGDEYVRGAWPWVVAIFKRNAQQLNYICSGSLVSERHVISAAHCIYIKSVETKTNEIVAKVGAYDLDDLSDDIAKYIYIEKATAPDSYDPNTLKNDIIILTLKKKVVYNEYISPVCLWSEDRTDLSLIVNKRGVITGWGVKENGEAGRGKPRRARIPVVSTETCRASREEFHRLTSSTTFCGGDRNGTGPCNGDSGGGLYMKEPGDNRWKLRGVVSVSLQSDDGEYECNVQQYIIFTDVAKYLPWIKSILSMA